MEQQFCMMERLEKSAAALPQKYRMGWYTRVVSCLLCGTSPSVRFEHESAIIESADQGKQVIAVLWESHSPNMLCLDALRDLEGERASTRRARLLGEHIERFRSDCQNERIDSRAPIGTGYAVQKRISPRGEWVA